MEIIGVKENQITFETELDESLANAVRKYVNRIPILAIDEVEIFKNDSPLYDETVAHRIGLIPIKDAKVKKEEIKLDLDVKKEGMVYSGELKGDAEVIFEKIPITFLKKGQEIKIISKIKKGRGIEHSKFSPGLMYYRHGCDIIMGKKFYEKIKKICPENKIEEKGEKIIIKDHQKREVCDVCEGICEKEGENIEVIPSKKIIITVESFGQLEVKEIFKGAIETLLKDLKDFSENLKK